MKILVSGEALKNLICALIGSPFLIKELQATRGMDNNPIDILIDEYNSAILKRDSEKKIANCRCGAGQPKIVERKATEEDKASIIIYCKNKYAHPNSCTVHGNTMVVGEADNIKAAIETWNALNTDQHGQQVTKTALEFTTWDGELNHLPPRNTCIVIKDAKNNHLRSGYLSSYYETQGVDWEDGFYPFAKGDQFAIITEI